MRREPGAVDHRPRRVPAVAPVAGRGFHAPRGPVCGGAEFRGRPSLRV